MGALAQAGPPEAADDPLERLYNRSAEERWEKLRERYQATQPPAPLTSAPGRSLLEIAIDPHAREAAPPAPEQESAPASPEPAGVVDPGRLLRYAASSVSADSQYPSQLDPELRAVPLADASLRQPADADGPEVIESPGGQKQVMPLPSTTVQLRPITDIQPFFDYSPTGGDPCEHLCPAPADLCPEDPDRLCPEPFEMPMSGAAERFFPHVQFYWAASNMYHNPLYFENPVLERYGHVHHCDGVEPLFSMARFGVQLAALPYQMALDVPCRRQYALGWYRPGDFTPKLLYQPPLNARAAITAAGVYTGLGFLLP